MIENLELSGPRRISMEIYDWGRIYDLVKAEFPDTLKGSAVWGVPRGGCHIAQILRDVHGCPIVCDVNDAETIVDDIVDSGVTKDSYTFRFPEIPFWAPIDKRVTCQRNTWVSFPWEGSPSEPDDVSIASRFLQTLGVDTSSEGLEDTPRRLLSSLR